MNRFAIVAGLCFAWSALAQTYPSRPIEMIVPIAPGGGMDVQARLLAELVEPELKQKIVAINRPGAGGIIGVALVAKAAPDGHTIGAVWSARARRCSVSDLHEVLQPAERARATMSPRMRGLVPGLRMAGSAITVEPARGDNLIVHDCDPSAKRKILAGDFKAEGSMGKDDWCVLMRLLEDVTGDRVRSGD